MPHGLAQTLPGTCSSAIVSGAGGEQGEADRPQSGLGVVVGESDDHLRSSTDDSMPAIRSVGAGDEKGEELYFRVREKRPLGCPLCVLGDSARARPIGAVARQCAVKDDSSRDCFRDQGAS